MSAVAINIRDEVSPLLNQLSNEADRLGLFDAVLIAGVEAVRDRFVELEMDSAHHKTALSFGANRTHVYERARGDVSGAVVGSAAVVSITGLSGEIISQRYFGGTIKPKNGKKLSIPARTEFYGHSPKEFDRAMFKPLYGRNGVYALALVEDTHRQLVSGKNAGKFVKAQKKFVDDVLTTNATHGAEAVAFWLVDEVTQPEDKSVIPTQEEFEAAIFNKLDGWAQKNFIGGRMSKSGGTWGVEF